MIDPSNAVVALCAEGMALEGSPEDARRCFEQAWAARRDDLDAAIAAHYLARHQATAADRLHWNTMAARHAEAVADGRADGLFASFYLNLADSQAEVGQEAAAIATIGRAVVNLAALPADGYRQLLTGASSDCACGWGSSGTSGHDAIGDLQAGRPRQPVRRWRTGAAVPSPSSHGPRPMSWARGRR